MASLPSIYEIYGYDFEATDSVAKQLKEILQKVPGAADVVISRSEYQPEYQVDFDREKLAIYGLNLSTAAHICVTVSTEALLHVSVIR